MDQWYYRSNKGETGPFSRDELTYLLRSGIVPATAEIRDGLASPWIPLKDTAFAPKTEPKPKIPSVMQTTIDSKPAGETKSAAEPQTTPPKRPMPNTILARRFRNPDDWIAGLIATAVLLLIASILLWFWSRPVVTGLGNGQETLAASATGDGDDSTTSVGAEAADNESGNPTASESSGVPEVSEDDAAVMADQIESEPVPEDVPQEEPVTTAAAQPESSRTPEDAFRVRLPTPDELEKDRSDDGKIPSHAPRLQTSNLRGRNREAREAAIENSGGSVESERAVALALQWLKSIQQRDGSWSFQHVGPDAKKGSLESPLAATSLAVLCFLGAGNTTESGTEKEVVRRAFDFLSKETDGRSSRLSETMYVHALVMMAFAELAAMEPSESDAKKSAQKLLSLIEAAQDPRGGGWRYSPGQAGDLSVTGWQIMALQSGKTCGLDVADQTITRSHKFLDSVSYNSGAQYSYTPGNGSTPCMTAVGLLSRVYLGWPRTTQPLKTGLRRLSTMGPDPANIYLNYYATLALHHYGGEPWDAWNEKLRPQLIESQITERPSAGSWRVTDPHGHSGGQIYQTCLSILCLEVYYRYLPMFDGENTKSE
ncbi:MAG: hypothetical protein JNL58_23630 [Planctomyces sp.]|nr:hypothetical protein [Planctomyces sp.]